MTFIYDKAFNMYIIDIKLFDDWLVFDMITSPKFGKFVSRFVGNWESPRFPKPDDLIIIFLSFLTSTALNFMM